MSILSLVDKYAQNQLSKTRTQLPSQIALQNNSLHVLGVPQADPENVGSFLVLYGLNFDVLLNPAGEIRKKYKCVSEPQKVLIDPEGRIAFVEKGSVPHNKTDEKEQMLRGIK